MNNKKLEEKVDRYLLNMVDGFVSVVCLGGIGSAVYQLSTKDFSIAPLFGVIGGSLLLGEVLVSRDYERRELG